MGLERRVGREKKGLEGKVGRKTRRRGNCFNEGNTATFFKGTVREASLGQETPCGWGPAGKLGPCGRGPLGKLGPCGRGPLGKLEPCGHFGRYLAQLESKELRWLSLHSIYIYIYIYICPE